ncbi:V-type proton ATPase subunit C isoform X1 [Apis mellifera caucasica]|uniref:V-type proton ATPase subunit C n=1 Tax=Apis mellifera TaxID=7460 RepID=A0A7M7GQB6_APIME|nr:V-type proton ATPase subunit C isoform X1 [Apis mellifera]XP_016767799.1 V-type proton ATPase subunit C isoform X1 [Apis mellifera]KAG6800887.1 V-type proton ATPase subunit C isoform X1 [Apis mellifera caucasica]KAG9433712.1 V-type proton ATPase subunit C isoform X1 [Apis mellifera carnica]|eukprot:XP_006562158.1 V-type proton ATPase subunit C isoform X1 [Apis mellifera]
MTEYWLISAPGDKTCQQTWETMNNLTSKQHSLSVNYKFHIPDLKVGTLDQLVGLSDDLGKLDTYVEQITRKVATYLGEVLEDQRDKLHENLLANNSQTSVDGESSSPEGGPDTPPNTPVTPSHKSSKEHHKQWKESEKCEPEPAACLGDLPSYITRFQWDMAKYPIKQSLRNIADIISKQVGQIDADLKTKSTTYNNLKGSLQNLEKKQTGSLLTRNLADLVKKEHFILDSEYLTTLLVIVPRANFQDWYSGYEKLTKMVVPRTTQLITQDSEYGLFTVTLFKKVIEEFKLHAREKKFIVRDFTYNEEELAAGKNEITKLVTDKKKQFGPLVRWLKVNFSECFCAWIHVKALRVFVESVLRYGLPVNFQAILLHPHRKCARRLRDVLNQHYAHLDSSATASSAAQGTQDSVDIPGLGFGQNDYFPYVYYKINVDMVDNKV